MKIGLQVPSFTWPGGASAIAGKLADIARAADDNGFHSLWLMDHFFQIVYVGPKEHDMLEAYTALGYLAGVTRRVKLGTMVTGVNYRYPGVLIKSLSTLDVLSGGRAYLGIGAAWFEEEAQGLGIPFPPIATRFELLEEALQIAQQMWSDDNGPYHGKHNQLSETLNVPQPLSKPHPPILVAGGGEQKTLKLVAKYADACNIIGDPDTIRHKFGVLRRHCDALGRDYNSIEKTILGTVHLAPGEMSAADVIAQCRELADLGVNQAIFNMPNVHDIRPLEIFGREIIPEVAGF
ncbi:MAG: LLM class F420-dependent oxidoreductase [Porticoccaceae bacterium]